MKFKIMFGQHCCSYQLLLFLLVAIPKLIICGPVSSPEIAAKTGKSNNNLAVQQQQHQQLHQQQQQQHKFINQDAHLNSLNVYATNYDVISNNQNSANGNEDQFKPSYKLPEMETNFTPIQNGNSIAPEFANNIQNYAAPAPVLMQYLPQTINEGGIQYLQLMPTRPIMVPIGPYFTGNNAPQALPYHQHITPSNNIDYSGRPLLSALPVNMPPPAPTPLVDVPASPVPAAYSMQPYVGGNISPYKQNFRINRETKDKQLLGPISLNMNEYIPTPNSQTQQHATFSIRARP